MLITLISPYPDITAFGPRTLSSWLRENGFATRLVFLPDPHGDDLSPGLTRYADSVLEELIPLCADADLIGISLMTNYFDNAREITAKLRGRVNAPILWGGVHPTVRPEQCAREADIACLGDGEEALLELAQRIRDKQDYADVANLWMLRQGELVQNPPRPLSQDLDRYPRPDYSCEEHYILHQGRIKPLTFALIKEFLAKGTVSSYLGRIGYQTMTGRGCPHKCTYCVNDAVKRLYGPKGYLRWRGTEHVMAELEWVKANLDFVGLIWISDDAFFGRPLEDIREFCREYRARINLPFTCLASPLTLSEEKLDLLVNSGMIYLQMGVQSGSARIQKLFNRQNMNNERMLKAMRIINKYKDRLYPPNYDFILDVPYETDQDKVESIKFIARIPKPFTLQPFSLVLYPGTELHRMAVADGFIADETRDVYTKSYTMREPNYLNLLITLAKGGKMPPWLLDFCVSPPLLAVFNNQAAKPLVKAGFLGLKKAWHIFKRLSGRA